MRLKLSRGGAKKREPFFHIIVIGAAERIVSDSA